MPSGQRESDISKFKKRITMQFKDNNNYSTTVDKHPHGKNPFERHPYNGNSHLATNIQNSTTVGSGTPKSRAL